VDVTQVVVEQTNIAAGHLKGRRAVPEDPLQREDVAPVREESPSETMPKDVRRAPLSQTDTG
jgi:hypothetical protein